MHIRERKRLIVMRCLMKLLSVWLLIYCFVPVPAQGAAVNSGQESSVLLSEVGDGDIGAWFERALNNDRPWKLMIHVCAEASLWNAEIYSNDHIRSYLKALRGVEVVEIPLEDGLWDDALEIGYAFYMPDGSEKTFIFQEGRVCIYPQNNGNDLAFPVIGRGGMDYFLGVYGVQSFY